MKHVSTLSVWLTLTVIPLAGFLTACGSSSNDEGTDTTTVTGSVTAAPVEGASVVARDTAGNTLAGPVSTAADGTYTLRIANASLASDLLLESSGGTYTDEATGLSVTAGTLAAHIAGGSLLTTAQVHMTPATTIVRDLVQTHGMSLNAAQSAFETAFGFGAETSVAPVDATDPTAGASDAQLLAGLRAAAFSQLTMDLGLTTTEQFDLLPALAEDLAVGSLDGIGANGAVTVAGSTLLPADIQNRFSQAMVGFHAGAHNNTDLSNDKIGAVPFAKLALSDSYKVEYLSGMMETMAGKTAFKLRVSNLADDTAAAGLNLSLMPMMYMASGMMHSSPIGGCSESATAGEYDCTVYYLMASAMSNGMSMGYWQLKVMIGGMMGESVTFSPAVMMAMGDTAKVTLRGQTGSDMIAGMAMDGGMAMAENRSYYLFKDSLGGMTGNHTLTLFVAAKESMMSYKAVSAGTLLNSGDAAYELTVASMAVEISTDGSTWLEASNSGNGLWTATGITGLTDGTTSNVHVRLTINGEQKTTNGATPVGDGSNDYGTFMLTPGGM